MMPRHNARFSALAALFALLLVASAPFWHHHDHEHDGHTDRAPGADPTCVVCTLASQPSPNLGDAAGTFIPPLNAVAFVAFPALEFRAAARLDAPRSRGPPLA